MPHNESRWIASYILIVLTTWILLRTAASTSNIGQEKVSLDAIIPNKNDDDDNIPAVPDLDPVIPVIIESERLAEYYKRNYTWPIERYVPNTLGWRRLMEDRFEQLAAIENRGERYEGYLQTVHTAMFVPNFTEYGFGLAKCPNALLDALQKGIHDGLPTARLEKSVEIIDAPEQPLFIDRPDLTARVVRELQNFAKEWAKGVDVTPYGAYGFRLYQNQSQLYMHVDKPQTHIISFILHIDSSTDSEPWPIYIEDFKTGQTHEVVLQPGDMLFYESSKCLHGRPKPFHGSWYSSVFVHYYPTVGWTDTNHKLEAHYVIPPTWAQFIPYPNNTDSDVENDHDEQHKHRRRQRQLPALQLKGTSLKEPECSPEDWCNVRTAVPWKHGPGQQNVWISPDGTKIPFHPEPVAYIDPSDREEL